MVADWLNQMFSHGKPFLKFSRLHLVLRILQMCYDIRNGSYSCFCAANLITSLHALTTFHCVDNRAYGDKCAERDFSDGEIFFCLSGCPLSEGMSEFLFFHHHRENKKITHPFDNWAEFPEPLVQPTKRWRRKHRPGVGIVLWENKSNQNLKRQEEKKRIIHRKIQCASVPKKNSVDDLCPHICELVLLLKIRFSASSWIYNIHPFNEISFRDWFCYTWKKRGDT